MELNNGEMKSLYFEGKPFWIIGLTSCRQERSGIQLLNIFCSQNKPQPSFTCGQIRRQWAMWSLRVHCYMFTCTDREVHSRKCFELLHHLQWSNLPSWQPSKAIQVHSQGLSKSLYIHINKSYTQCYTSLYLYSSCVFHVAIAFFPCPGMPSHRATLDFRNQELTLVLLLSGPVTRYW